MAGPPLPPLLWADAAARPPRLVFEDPTLLAASAALVLALLAAAMVLFLVERWRRRQFDGGVQESAESLSSFRSMYERGELSKAEYERVRNKMAAKLKAEIAAGTDPAAHPPAAGGAGSAGPTDGGELSPGADSPTGPGGPPREP